MRLSNSKIQCFKSCRRAYELRYKYGVIPEAKSDAIERGLSYHKKIEKLLKDGFVPLDDNLKTNAMALAFQKHIMPKLGVVEATEQWMGVNLTDEHQLVGILDARNNFGTPIEHKTTSQVIDGSYWKGLENNEQILTYMALSQKTDIIYTVCRAPTLRQKKGESDEDYMVRCLDWYDEDTESKIDVQRIFRQRDVVNSHIMDLKFMAELMADCTYFYRNPQNCMRFGRECEYMDICHNFVPSHWESGKEYVGYYKKEKEYD